MELMDAIPVISTSHIHPNTAGFLMRRSIRLEIPIAPYAQGFFLYVPEARVDLTWAGPDLLALFKWARGEGYGWVRLDADADLVEGLDNYEKEWL